MGYGGRILGLRAWYTNFQLAPQEYRGDPDFQSRSLLKTEQSLPQDLPPHKISGKLVVRQKSFTPYAMLTDRQTDRQTDHRQLIGSGLGS